jgi:hypothetical protein
VIYPALLYFCQLLSFGRVDPNRFPPIPQNQRVSDALQKPEEIARFFFNDNPIWINLDVMGKLIVSESLLENS